jgi:glycosyltransferase involved in cell wall biosynthesis
LKILIAVPTYETITPDTFKSIYGLDKCGHWVVFDFIRGYDVATARNHIAQACLNEKADYVLMVDNDVTLPPDALKNLLSHDEAVVLGFYAHRDNDNIYRGRTCVCRMYQPNGEAYFNYPLESEYTADEMRAFRENKVFKLRIHGGGMGCALIKADVFNQLSYPWFDWVNYADNNRGMLSEDLYFCEKCKQLNIPIYVDSRVGCGHLMRRIQGVM